MALRRAPVRWLAPLIALLVVLALLFGADGARQGGGAFPAADDVAQTFAQDPRLQLWDRTLTLIGERPWIGYGFGKSILAEELKSESRDPLLSHAHNVFMSQWLQTGAIGLAVFVALLAALVARYVRFVRSPDDAVALLGVIGIALVAGLRGQEPDRRLPHPRDRQGVLGAERGAAGVRRAPGARLRAAPARRPAPARPPP